MTRDLIQPTNVAHVRAAGALGVSDESTPGGVTPSILLGVLDTAISDEAADELRAAIPENTRRAFKTDWAHFTAWCAVVGRTAMPATPATLVEYARHSLDTPSERTGRPVKPATVQRRFDAIRAYHHDSGQTPPDTKVANRFIRGRARGLVETRDPQSQVNKAEPLTPPRMRLMLASLDRNTVVGRRDAAILLLGFSLAARASEIVSLRLGDFRETPSGVEVYVFRIKTGVADTHPIPASRDIDLCPVNAWREVVRDIRNADMPDDERGPTSCLFRRAFKGGHRLGDCITERSISIVVQRTATAAGLPGQWSSHAMRRGFATSARAAGASLEEIARAGGWSARSTELPGYIATMDAWQETPLARGLLD